MTGGAGRFTIVFIRMEWNAEQYHRISEPQFEWGLQVLARLAALPVRGDETVLDAGCGTGRLTQHLAGLFPRGRVVAADLSAPMLQTLAKTLNNGNGAKRQYATSSSSAQKAEGEHAQSVAHASDRPIRRSSDHPIRLVLADFQSLPFVDAFHYVFSTAAFHWAPDHDALFRSIFHALRPGGHLVAQCGGGANLAGIREREQILMRHPRFAAYFSDWRPPWTYADVPTTRDRLLNAGFFDTEVWLEEAPYTMPDAASFRAFAETVVARTQVDRIPDAGLRNEYLDCLVDLAAGDYTFDYVRLNINAQRGR
jgi:trans-aconitate 2-methyltransferase